MYKSYKLTREGIVIVDTIIGDLEPFNAQIKINSFICRLVIIIHHKYGEMKQNIAQNIALMFVDRERRHGNTLEFMREISGRKLPNHIQNWDKLSIEIDAHLEKIRLLY